MKGWRLSSWLIAGWTVFVIVVGALVLFPQAPGHDPAATNEPDSTAYQFGYAAAMTFFLWIPGMLVLGPAWYLNRPRALCPICGKQVSPRAGVCPRCGFRPGYPIQAPLPGTIPAWGQPPPGWPPQATQQPPPGWPAQALQQPPPGWGPPPGWPPQTTQSWPPQGTSQPPIVPPPAWPPAAGQSLPPERQLAPPQTLAPHQIPPGNGIDLGSVLDRPWKPDSLDLPSAPSDGDRKGS